MNPTTATVNTEVLNPSRIPLQNRPGQNKNTILRRLPLGRRAAARAAGYDRNDRDIRDEKGTLLQEVRGVRRVTQRLRPASHPLADAKRYDLPYGEALEGFREGVARARALVDEAERRAEAKRLSRPKV